MQLNTEAVIEQAPSQTRGRLILLLLFIFFVAPVIAVIAMYQWQWHPSGSSFGHLVSPAKKITLNNDLPESQQATNGQQVWHEKWSLVVVSQTCASDCLAKLKDMRQLHASLAKDIDRVQRILVSKEADVAAIKASYPDLIVLDQPSDSVSQLAHQFVEAGATNEATVYLVDPLGNLVMWFDPAIPTVKVRKDLTRLLTYSWAG